MEAVANVLASALDRARAEADSHRRALHDPLTGLANRAFLDAHLPQSLAAAARDGGEVALLLLDVDRFKVVNDTLGHGVGDALLRVVAERLRASVRGGDVVARFGGDEFVIACDVADSAMAVAALAERVIETLAQPIVVDGHELFVSASVGIVIADARETDADSLLRDADVAMYRAKESGGGRYEIFDAELRARVLRRLTVEHELRGAVADGQLELHLQPLIGLADGDLRGFEALVRWRHPERGLVPPAGVHPRRRGDQPDPAGRALGARRRPAGGWRELQALTSERIGISVNLSPRQLTSDLPGEVESALRAAGVRADDLTLEITESLLVEDGGALGVLEQLRALGAKVALDDFGTGWSSLAALRRYPVDILKLDRSLIGVHRPRRVGRRRHARGDHDGQGARPRRRRRGHRGARAGRGAARARLRARPGLPLLTPRPGRRGGGATVGRGFPRPSSPRTGCSPAGPERPLTNASYSLRRGAWPCRFPASSSKSAGVMSLHRVPDLSTAASARWRWEIVLGPRSALAFLEHHRSIELARSWGCPRFLRPHRTLRGHPPPTALPQTANDHG